MKKYMNSNFNRLWGIFLSVPPLTRHSILFISIRVRHPQERQGVDKLFCPDLNLIYPLNSQSRPTTPTAVNPYRKTQWTLIDWGPKHFIYFFYLFTGGPHKTRVCLGRHSENVALSVDVQRLISYADVTSQNNKIRNVLHWLHHP